MVSRAAVVGLALTAFSLAGCAERARVVAPTVVIVEPVNGRGVDTASSESPAAPTSWAPKEEVDVEWHGSWWPAILMEPRGRERWLVHYEGYGDDWDEVVADQRIRERHAEARVDGDEPSDDADP